MSVMTNEWRDPHEKLSEGSEVWKSCMGEGWAKMDGEERKGWLL